MQRWRWAVGALFALVLIGGTLLTRTIAQLEQQLQESDITIDRTEDTLNCLLYEVTAHRLANQADHDHAGRQHGFPMLVTEEHGRPRQIPPHLREACEAILPGSTGDG